MLAQPAILGETPSDHAPIACFKHPGPALSGRPIIFDAGLSFQPAVSAANLDYTWDFGDHSSASGVKVSHTYQATGTYTVTLTVKSAMGQRSIPSELTVFDQAPLYTIPYRWDNGPGTFPPNPAVNLPTADNSLSDSLEISASTSLTRHPTSANLIPLHPTIRQGLLSQPLIIGATASASFIVLLLVLARQRQKRKKLQQRRTGGPSGQSAHCRVCSQIWRNHSGV
jgi:hypothetical protein